MRLLSGSTMAHLLQQTFFFFFTEKILLFKEIYYTLIYKISQDSMTFSNTFLMFMITLDWKFGLKIR